MPLREAMRELAARSLPEGDSKLESYRVELRDLMERSIYAMRRTKIPEIAAELMSLRLLLDIKNTRVIRHQRERTSILETEFGID